MHNSSFSDAVDRGMAASNGWKRRAGVSLAFAVWLCCGADGSAAEPDPHRLDPQIRPVTQTLELSLDPGADRYQGVARVQVQFGVSTNRFRFHGKEMELGRATLDGKELTLTPGQAGLISATSSELIPAGEHVFEVEFNNDYNRDGTGLYKVVTGGEAYLFSQMEPLGARQAFPCWDEPGFKIPWRITLTIPSSSDAVSNMSIARTATAGQNKIVEFGRTPPMSSYLVALAVGSFESVPVPGQGVPGRMVTVRGQIGLAELAAAEAPPLLAWLEEYFGIPYPYPKLDHLAVPEFVFGAMENVGAITYKDSLLLLDGANVSYGNRRLLIEIMAHEMAHMWFGNLVTMQWWDDLWLNESFATWMSFKAAARVHPNDRFHLLGFQDVLSARAADSQPSVRPIRRPFRSDDNFLEAFDVLSYQKGHSILRMVEGWLGEERLRKGLRQYFLRHQWGNARAEDLWEAFAEASDGSIREVLRGYMEQPGIPWLTITRLPGDRCQVRQQRYRTIIATNAADQTWHVPIVLRYGSSSAVRESRFLLTKPMDEFHVPGLDQADWVYPNAGESGYYTWSLAPDLANALTNRALIRLSDTERLGLLNAASLAVKAGTLPAGQWLTLLLTFTDDPAPEIRTELVSDLTSIYHEYLSAGDQPAFANLMRSALRPVLDSIGFTPKPNELPELSSLRSVLLLTLGIEGRDREVVAFCREQALRQLADPQSVDAGIAEPVLRVTTWHGDATWSDQLRAAFERATAPDIRTRLLSAVVPFQDPALARSGLEYLLTDAVRRTDMMRAVSAVRQPELAPVIFAWISDRYDLIKQRVPEDILPFLTRFLAAGDPSLLEKGRSFFLDRTRKTPLTETELQKVAETVGLRTALRDRCGSDIAARLEQERVARAESGAKAIEGSMPPDWQAERWLNSPPLHLPELRGKVVLVRWWTAGCPYCSASAPALRSFSERYGPQGLVVLGMYHHKSPEPFDPKVYEETARRYQFEFPVAFDPDWRDFKRWMRDSNGNAVSTGWTSVTFVLDKKGVVRHVHPGGQYLEGDPAHEKLTAIVEQLLSES